MPFIDLKTNIEVNKEKVESLKTSFGKIITTLPGKSETWLMVNISDKNNLFFQGKADPAAILEVKVYGNALNDSILNKCTGLLTSEVSKTLNIDSSRIYINFLESILTISSLHIGDLMDLIFNY